MHVKINERLSSNQVAWMHS